MRIRLFILILVLIATLAAAAAGEEPEAEVLLGRVEAVNRETGEVTVSVLDGTEEGDDPKLLTVTIDPRTLPRGVRPGVMVRAWGGFSGTGIGSPLFSAIRIHPVGGRGQMRPGDPTGVRHRLGLRRRLGPGGPPGGGRR